MAMVFTYETIGTVNVVVASWTSDGDGDADGTTIPISGHLIKGGTNPSGTAAPADNYDIVITDPAGANVLALSQDDLIDRDTANSEEVYFSLTAGTSAFPVVSDALTITVAAAGDTKSGVLRLYWVQSPR